MNVVLISSTDWANVSYEMQEALKSVGVEAHALQKKAHSQFKYPKKAHVYKSIKEVSTYARNADIIQFMHSHHTSLQFKPFNSDKGIAVFHGGSVYRKNPNKYNDFWNSRAHVALIQTGDLLGIGSPPAKNQVWFLPPIDTEGLQPHYDSVSENKRIIAHRPSSAPAKSTNRFNKMMDMLSKEPQLKDKFIYEVGRSKNWVENINQMKRCDIYFDACTPIHGGFTYGEWGIAALEACCLGKIVVSHFLSVERYRREFGIECAIQHANNFKQVEEQMRRLILMPNAEFMALREKTRVWVVENHSRKVIGQRLVDIYNKHLTWEGK